MDWLEDDLICCYGGILRERGALVLAEGGNQVSAFVYALQNGRRKAPDLVVFRYGVLGIFEAKIHEHDLFKGNKKEVSDFEALKELLASEEQKQRLLDEARRRILVMGMPIPEDVNVSCGIVSDEQYPCEIGLHDHSLLRVRVNIESDFARSMYEHPAWVKLYAT